MEFIGMALILVAVAVACVMGLIATVVIAVRFWWVILLGLVALQIFFGGGA